MHVLAIGILGCGVGLALALLYVRCGHRLFLKDPETPPERYGFALEEPASRERVAEIIRAFFTGYNAAVSGRSPAEIRRRCEALPPLFHPFAFEGNGMGYGARCLLAPRQHVAGLERHIESVHPGYQFMAYIGLGVWSGFRGPRYARRAARAIRAPRFGGLLYDGFGFQRGFFHRAKNPRAHAILDAQEEWTRLHSYQGFGRSLWFVFRDDRPGLLAAAAALPENAQPCCWTGIGLAVTFTSADRLDRALALLDELPATWQPLLVRGLRLALFVRAMGQGDYLAGMMQASGHGAVLRAHLEHALRAYDATRQRPSFLADFTAAC